MKKEKKTYKKYFEEKKDPKNIDDNNFRPKI